MGLFRHIAIDFVSAILLSISVHASDSEASNEVPEQVFSGHYVYLGLLASGITLQEGGSATKSTGEGGPETDSTGKWTFKKPNRVSIYWSKVTEDTYTKGQTVKVKKKPYREIFSFNSDLSCLVPGKTSAELADSRVKNDYDAAFGGAKNKRWGVLCKKS